MRPASPTWRRWLGFDLSADNGRAVYIPPGCAHGFQTLTDEAELFYMMTEPFRPELACGARWDDPAIGINWPLAAPIVSEQDRALPLLPDPAELT